MTASLRAAYAWTDNAARLSKSAPSSVPGDERRRGLTAKLSRSRAVCRLERGNRLGRKLQGDWMDWACDTRD